VVVSRSDRFGRSAEARHGDLPPIQPPDQSLKRTGLAPPLSTHSGRLDPGQGHQGSTGVARLVVEPSPSWPLSLRPQHSTEPVSCSPPLSQSLHYIKSPLPHPSVLPHFTWTNACVSFRRAQGLTQSCEPAHQRTATATLDLGPYTAPTPLCPAVPSVPAHVFTQPTPSLPLLLPHTTYQSGAAVGVSRSDRSDRSAEARHGDLPPLQPPDQSLDRTGLAPPPSTHRNDQDPGQGPQGSTGV